MNTSLGFWLRWEHFVEFGCRANEKTFKVKAVYLCLPAAGSFNILNAKWSNPSAEMYLTPIRLISTCCPRNIAVLNLCAVSLCRLWGQDWAGVRSSSYCCSRRVGVTLQRTRAWRTCATAGCSTSQNWRKQETSGPGPELRWEDDCLCVPPCSQGGCLNVSGFSLCAAAIRGLCMACRSDVFSF